MVYLLARANGQPVLDVIFAAVIIEGFVSMAYGVIEVWHDPEPLFREIMAVIEELNR